jgi:ligand-binding SRPBCC domain-containing protein
MTVEFEVTTRIAAPRDVVFDLSLDVDAHTASLAESNERAVGGVTTGPIGLGEDVTWRAIHFGIRFTMTSRVTDLDRPSRFVDQQVRGPFRRFDHEHVFEPDGGGTVMIDRVSFDAPAGVIGRVVERLVLGRYLEQLIETRGRFLKTEAEKRHRAES